MYAYWASELLVAGRKPSRKALQELGAVNLRWYYFQRLFSFGSDRSRGRGEVIPQVLGESLLPVFFGLPSRQEEHVDLTDAGDIVEQHRAGTPESFNPKTFGPEAAAEEVVLRTPPRPAATTPVRVKEERSTRQLRDKWSPASKKSPSKVERNHLPLGSAETPPKSTLFRLVSGEDAFSAEQVRRFSQGMSIDISSGRPNSQWAQTIAGYELARACTADDRWRDQTDSSEPRVWVPSYQPIGLGGLGDSASELDNCRMRDYQIDKVRRTCSCGYGTLREQGSVWCKHQVAHYLLAGNSPNKRLDAQVSKWRRAAATRDLFVPHAASFNPYKEPQRHSRTKKLVEKIIELSKRPGFNEDAACVQLEAALALLEVLGANARTPSKES